MQKPLFGDISSSLYYVHVHLNFVLPDVHMKLVSLQSAYSGVFFYININVGTIYCIGIQHLQRPYIHNGAFGTFLCRAGLPLFMVYHANLFGL